MARIRHGLFIVFAPYFLLPRPSAVIHNCSRPGSDVPRCSVLDLVQSVSADQNEWSLDPSSPVYDYMQLFHRVLDGVLLFTLSAVLARASSTHRTRSLDSPDCHCLRRIPLGARAEALSMAAPPSVRCRAACPPSPMSQPSKGHQFHARQPRHPPATPQHLKLYIITSAAAVQSERLHTKERNAAWVKCSGPQSGFLLGRDLVGNRTIHTKEWIEPMLMFWSRYGILQGRALGG